MKKKQYVSSAMIIFAFLSYFNLFAQLTDVSTSLSNDSFYGVKFLDENNGYVVGWGASTTSILKTNNGGKSWESLPSPSALYFDVNFTDSNTIYLAGYSMEYDCGLVYKSIDAGKNWTTQFFDGNSNPLSKGFYKYLIKGNIHFVSGYSGAILKSTDKGETWENTNTPDNLSTFRAIDFFNNKIGYAACDPAGGFSDIRVLYKTTNGGSNWTKVTNLPTNTIIASISMTDSVTTYLFGYSSGTQAVLKTTDDGKTWKKVLSGLTQKAFQTGQFFNNNLGVTGGENGEFHLTKDAGLTWQKFVVKSSTSVLASSFLNENSGFVVGNFGAIWKYSSLADVEFTKLNLINVFPNPAKDFIEFTNESLIESVQVLSINGESLNLPVVNGNKVDISSLSAGKYFIKIGSQNINFVKN